MHFPRSYFVLVGFLLGIPTAEAMVSLAVLELNPGPGLTAAETVLLTDNLRASLAELGEVELLDRTNMDRILAEQTLVLSGSCEQEGCTVKVGRLLGVQKLVGGSVGKLGETYVLTLQLTDIATGKIERSVQKTYQGVVDGLLQVVSELGRELLLDRSAQPAAVALPRLQADTSADEAGVAVPAPAAAEVVPGATSTLLGAYLLGGSELILGAAAGWSILLLGGELLNSDKDFFFHKYEQEGLPRYNRRAAVLLIPAAVLGSTATVLAVGWLGESEGSTIPAFGAAALAGLPELSWWLANGTRSEHDAGLFTLLLCVPAAVLGYHAKALQSGIEVLQGIVFAPPRFSVAELEVGDAPLVELELLRGHF